MGQALLSGIQSQSQQHNITAIEPHQPTRERVADELGINMLASISELPDEDNSDNNVDVIMLAVKPQMMRDVLADLQPLLSGNELIISVAAGTSMQQLAQACAPDQAIIRAMPNTPALIGMGITALTAGAHANAEHIRLAENLLAGCGEVVVLEEEAQLAAVTAISGSGPAYFFAWSMLCWKLPDNLACQRLWPTSWCVPPAAVPANWPGDPDRHRGNCRKTCAHPAVPLPLRWTCSNNANSSR